MSDNQLEAQKLLQLADDAEFNQGDKESAYSYTKKAADLGNAEAMYYLGNYHRDGIQIRHYENSGKIPRKLLEDRCFIQADNAAALKWYTKAADGGNGDAMRTIACAYEEGKLGLDKDEAKAREWFDKLIDSHDTKAMSNLGYYYLSKKTNVLSNGLKEPLIMVK